MKPSVSVSNFIIVPIVHVHVASLSAFVPDKKDRICITEKHTYLHFNNMQIYENKSFYVICAFLDIRFVEWVWVHLRRSHINSSVVIWMTYILYKIIYFGLVFITILLLLMNLHEIQMPVAWQIECFVPIYNAAHDTRIVDNLGKFILYCSLASIWAGTLLPLVQFVH